MPDEDRNPELAALSDVITDGVLREINLRWKGDKPPNFLLILVDGDMMEFSSATDDHEMLCDAMAEIVAKWVEDGHVQIEDDEAPATPHPAH